MLTTSRAATQPLRERLESLPWALPYLIFMWIFPLIGVASASELFWTIWWQIAFTAVYAQTWVRSDSAPVSGSVDRAVIITIALICLLAAVVVYISGVPLMAAYCFPYLAAIITFQLPRAYIGRSSIVLGVAMVVLLVSTYITGPRDVNMLIAPGVTVIGYFMTAKARQGVEEDRAKAVAAADRVEASKEGERARISADLHDVLGQTLTAINVNAQVGAKMLEAGREVEATQFLQQVQHLSHQALADMRAVVAATRQADINEELESARQLAKAAGIALDIKDDGHPPQGAPNTVAAHVLREGVANVVHHSAASRIRIQISPTELSIIDNGRQKKESHRQGTGLQKLRERAADVGELSWGQDQAGFRLHFSLRKGESSDKRCRG
ncbi:MAG: hypothetical protein KIA58_03740 [Winkia neuii]|uniref:sensor histidine kinase n=1 Tax=Winkia neuii TaxID=33007 RepID=UPI00241E24D3|nr:histidine kinase [Winkia neuii]MBS5947460.1 hypothetical protein [Winkia neuii]